MIAPVMKLWACRSRRARGATPCVGGPPKTHTIVAPSTGGNRAWPRFGRAWGLCLLFASGACHEARPAGPLSWDLARPAPLRPEGGWRVQMADLRGLPEDMVSRLCPEFDLVHIRSAGDWRRLRGLVAFPDEPALRAIDFQRGSVVGLVARLGRPADGRWPIEFDEVRLGNGTGWVRFRFRSGVYYPVLTGPYLLAAYVPGLREPQVVEINGRMFTLSP